MTAAPAERAAMARARELGASVLGTTSPNPPVGAVVLAADGTVAGEGATAPPGGPHAEACTDPRAVARDLRAAGALAGLAIKPGTPLEAYLDVLPEFDTLLVMTVEPGFGGQSFMPEVLPKVAEARRLVETGHLQLFLEVDGGINADTIEQAAAAGADVFVAGSAVYGAEDPARAIAALRERAAGAR